MLGWRSHDKTKKTFKSIIIYLINPNSVYMDHFMDRKMSPTDLYPVIRQKFKLFDKFNQWETGTPCTKNTVAIKIKFCLIFRILKFFYYIRVKKLEMRRIGRNGIIQVRRRKLHEFAHLGRSKFKNQFLEKSWGSNGFWVHGCHNTWGCCFIWHLTALHVVRILFYSRFGIAD